MRLGQMARKLAITPSDIAQHLASQGITLDDNANTKLDESHVRIILQKFDPEGLAQSIAEQADDSLEPVETIQNTPIEDTTPIAVDSSEPTPEADADIPDEQSEVIKAQKVSLTGLKVLGKIELPESKKEIPELSPSAEAQRVDSLRRDNYQGRRNTRDQRSYKNPISRQREQEISEELERRKEKAALDKERKTQNYLKKVKMSPPTKAVRLVDEPVMQMSQAELAPEPKGLWVRLIKWLST
ncbi:MAG TPA: hypothetical protein VK666_11675 [Chryseolinea sp.]|nr:hypothetical protein [Chryseolinea sp.]